MYLSVQLQEHYIYGLVIPYVQANRLVYYCFMDAGRRHQISGSETKNFITHCKTAGRASAYVSVHPAPKPHGGNT